MEEELFRELDSYYVGDFSSRIVKAIFKVDILQYLALQDIAHLCEVATAYRKYVKTIAWQPRILKIALIPSDVLNFIEVLKWISKTFRQEIEQIVIHPVNCTIFRYRDLPVHPYLFRTRRPTLTISLSRVFAASGLYVKKVLIPSHGICDMDFTYYGFYESVMMQYRIVGDVGFVLP